MTKLAPLYIGRFQPFHNGHLSVVKKIVADFGAVTIGIGSSQKHHTVENPLTYEERRELIVAALEEAGVASSSYAIVPIPDIDDFYAWPAHVDKIIHSLAPPHNEYDTLYTGSEVVAQCYKGHPSVKIAPVEFELPISATLIREKIANGEPWEDMVPPVVAALLKKWGVRRD